MCSRDKSIEQEVKKGKVKCGTAADEVTPEMLKMADIQWLSKSFTSHVDRPDERRKTNYAAFSLKVKIVVMHVVVIRGIIVVCVLSKLWENFTRLMQVAKQRILLAKSKGSFRLGKLGARAFAIKIMQEYLLMEENCTNLLRT